MFEVSQPGAYMPMDWGWGWGLMAMHGIGWLLLLAVVVIAAVVLLRGLGAGERRPEPRGRSAREVLDARYAAGEISREDYQRMKQDIG